MSFPDSFLKHSSRHTLLDARIIRLPDLICEQQILTVIMNIIIIIVIVMFSKHHTHVAEFDASAVLPVLEIKLG